MNSLLHNMITHTIDASKQSLGRIASRIAVLLRGKDTPQFTPNQAPDVLIEVKNLHEIKFLGTKLESKKYYRHSKYPGSLKEETLASLWARAPEKVLRLAIRGMLPPNRTRDRLLKRVIFK